MTDHFLEVTKVKIEEDAIRSAIQAALQRNRTYESSGNDKERSRFRIKLAECLRSKAKPYESDVSDSEHYKTIQRISCSMSKEFPKLLIDGRLRYGTAQKAFNLYLKFPWRLGQAAVPPHCPVDRIVLSQAGINGAWTKCKCEDEYREWIRKLTMAAKNCGLCLAEWEYKVWLSNEKPTAPS